MLDVLDAGRRIAAVSALAVAVGAAVAGTALRGGAIRTRALSRFGDVGTPHSPRAIRTRADTRAETDRVLATVADLARRADAAVGDLHDPCRQPPPRDVGPAPLHRAAPFGAGQTSGVRPCAR